MTTPLDAAVADRARSRSTVGINPETEFRAGWAASAAASAPRPILDAHDLDELPVHSVVQLVNDIDFPTPRYYEKTGEQSPQWLELDPTDRDDGETLLESEVVARTAYGFATRRNGGLLLVVLGGDPAGAHEPRHDGTARITAERRRQSVVEGHTAESDRGRARELMAAADCYVAAAQHGPGGWVLVDGSYAPPGGWPWDDSSWKPSDDPTRNLEIAGALIAAAIDAS